MAMVRRMLLLQRPRQSVATRFFSATVGVNNANTIYTGLTTANQIGTAHTAMELQGEFTHVQLILGNQSLLNPVVIVGATVLAAADFSDTRQDTAFAAGQAAEATFSGAAGVTIPIRDVPTSATGPTLVLSDKIALPSIPRSDVVGGRPALYIRIEQQCVAGTTEQVTTWTRQGSDWGDGSIPKVHTKGQVGAVRNGTLSAGTVPGTSSATCVLLGVRYWTRTKSMTVMFTGDSIVAAVNSTLNARAYGWAGRAANNNATLNTPVEICNVAISSNSSTNYSKFAQYAMPFLRPTHIAHWWYTPNDVATTVTQGALDGMDANAAIVKAAGDAIGAQFGVFNGIPRNTGTASFFDTTNSNIVVAYKAGILAKGYPNADTNVQLSDGATPQRIQLATNGSPVDLTDDGIHPNEAGDDAMVPNPQTLIASWKSQFLGA